MKGSTETLEQSYSEDPQIHKDAIGADPAKPAAVPSGSETLVESNPVEPGEGDDSVLNEPLRYVVDAPGAIEKAEVLLRKVRDARPDLASEVDSLLSGVESLESQALGLDQPAPEQAVVDTATGAPLPSNDGTQAAAGVNPGDRVVAKTKDGEYAGVVEDINDDGTLEILTDKNMKLSHVPVDSVTKEAAGESGSMALPAGIQSSRRQDVGKPEKVAAAPADKKELGAGPAAEAADSKISAKAEMAVKAARNAFMAGTLDLLLMKAYHPAAQAEIKRLLADKTLKFAASAFDKIESLDIGGGYTAKRSEGKDEVKTIAVLDKDGKEVARYPDAFGDDTVTIIKLFRQLHDIKEADDKAAAQSGEGGKESEKPKALPETEDEKKAKKKKKDDEDLEAAQKAFEQRLGFVREVVAGRVQKRYVVASQEDIDKFLLKGMTLEASMNEALKLAVDREVLHLLAMPDTELLSIRASLGSLKVRQPQVETKVSNEGLPFVAGLQLYAQKAGGEELDLGAAFGAFFQR